VEIIVTFNSSMSEWIGFTCLQTKTGTGVLSTREWTFGFNNRRERCHLTEPLLASKEDMCRMELGVFKTSRNNSN
jgi:hypothetical protein